MTSAAKDRPIALGGGEADWSICVVRELLHRSGTHWRHERQPCPDREHIDTFSSGDRTGG